MQIITNSTLIQHALLIEDKLLLELKNCEGENNYLIDD